MTWILLAALILAAAVIIACSPSRTDTAPAAPQASSDSGPSSNQPTFFAVRLFADDVSLAKSLPLSLSVETLGGVSTMLIPRGTDLPTVRHETFSTATDNQTSIEVHVLVGDRALAVDNVTVGKFSIVEVPPAHRGVPKFDVAFAVDDSGTFRFSVKDLGTGRSQAVSSAGSLSNPLAQLKISGMLNEAKAEEAKGEYGIARTTPDDLDSVTVYTKQLRDLVASTRAALKSGSAIPDTARRQCEEHLKTAEAVLEKNALPERASAKLNTLKADEIDAVLRSLGEAAKRCR